MTTAALSNSAVTRVTFIGFYSGRISRLLLISLSDYVRMLPDNKERPVSYGALPLNVLAYVKDQVRIGLPYLKFGLSSIQKRRD